MRIAEKVQGAGLALLAALGVVLAAVSTWVVVPGWLGWPWVFGCILLLGLTVVATYFFTGKGNVGQFEPSGSPGRVTVRGGKNVKIRMRRVFSDADVVADVSDDSEVDLEDVQHKRRRPEP